MVKIREQPEASSVILIDFSETGESGETYDVDVQTILWPRLRISSTIRSPWTTASRYPDCTESGQTYDAEAEAELVAGFKEKPTVVKGQNSGTMSSGMNKLP